MTTLIFTQPAVITSLMANTTFNDRGLCARFLYSIPTSTVGSRIFESKPIAEITAERYSDLIEALLNYKNDKPKLITLSPKAYEALKEFADDIEPKLIDELAEISQFAGKLGGSILRIAGLLYLAENPPKPDSDLLLTENFMRNAITIGEYFLEHAKVAYQLMGADVVTDQCKYILRQLSKTQPQIVTVRDIMRTCRKFSTADETLTPLNRLCEYGYSREIKPKTWEINPATYELKF